MRRYCAAAFAALIMLSQSPGQTKQVLVTVTNRAPVPRRSETVEVPVRDLGPVAAKDAAREFVVTAAGSAPPLLSQVEGSVLLFQSDFSALETKQFAVRRRTPEDPHPESLVAGMFVTPREDYAWENDRIAFRMYGPALGAEVNNGIDVWTKRVRYPIVAKWYREAGVAPAGKDPYHHDRGEGADFFEVGRSLGAGGCALWYEGRVHQPGVFSSWKTISSGPLRTEFELTYNGVTLGGVTFIEHLRISLDAGANLNRVTVRFDAPGAARKVLLACGLVKRAGTRLTAEAGRSWGLTNSDSLNGSLGTAVVFPHSALVRFAEDSLQYLLIGRAETGKSLTYYAGAGWTRSGDFASEQEWNSYIDARAALMASPLSVRCSQGK
jgi:hypothetical protein